MWVLDRLKHKAFSITPEASEIEGVEKRLFKEGKWHFLQENVWDKVIFKSGGLEPNACLYLMKYPLALKKKIDHLFNVLHESGHRHAEFPVSSIPYLRLDYLISQFDNHFDRGIPRGIGNQKAFFLSERIRQWFHEKFKKILQKQSS
jgi:hypothetical protein